MPSAPASTRACAPARVATLPPITSMSELALICATMSSTACACPCAVSTTRKSTPASISAWARRLASSPTPIAAPTTSRPAGSLVACGNFSLLVKSFTVISPRSRPASSTSGSFSTLCWRSSRSASSGATPTGAVTRGIGVITSATRRSVVGLEPDVAVGDDADQHAVRAGHRHAGDPVAAAQPVDVRDRGVGPAGHRVGDHARLGPLDHVHLLRLLLHGQVAVQHPDAALAGHGDRHPGLGHGVHRRGHQRDAEPVTARDPGAGVRLARQHRGVGGQQEHIIKGQADGRELVQGRSGGMGPPGRGLARTYLISHGTFTGSGSGDVPIL